MDGTPLQLALREMRDVVTSPLALGGMALAVALLTISGPFGTFSELGTAERFTYWALMVAFTYVLGQGTVTLVSTVLRPRLAGLWPRLIIAALIASLPVAAVTIAINTAFLGTLTVELALRLWFYVAVVTLAVAVTLGAFGQRLRMLEAAHAAVPVAGAAEARLAPPPILERVPLPQRGRLLALSVEDHYVDIVTDRGKTLVLMRLADAMRETVGIEGLQIHRSHWVARDAVVRTHRAEGKVSLELSNGVRLPVSRGFLPSVREAGLA